MNVNDRYQRYRRKSTSFHPSPSSSLPCLIANILNQIVASTLMNTKRWRLTKRAKTTTTEKKHVSHLSLPSQKEDRQTPSKTPNSVAATTAPKHVLPTAAPKSRRQQRLTMSAIERRVTRTASSTWNQHILYLLCRQEKTPLLSYYLNNTTSSLQLSTA